MLGFAHNRCVSVASSGQGLIIFEMQGRKPTSGIMAVGSDGIEWEAAVCRRFCCDSTQALFVTF